MHFSETKFQLYRGLSYLMTAIALFVLISIVPLTLANAAVIGRGMDALGGSTVILIMDAIFMSIGYLVLLVIFYARWVKEGSKRAIIMALHQAGMRVTKASPSAVRVPRKSGGVLDIARQNDDVDQMLAIEDRPSIGTVRSLTLHKRGIHDIDPKAPGLSPSYLQAMTLNLNGYAADLEQDARLERGESEHLTIEALMGNDVDPADVADTRNS